MSETPETPAAEAGEDVQVQAQVAAVGAGAGADENAPEDSGEETITEGGHDGMD